MYSEEAKSSNLAKFLCNFNKAFLDTCSLMEDSFPQFMETLDGAREYWKGVTEIIVLGECLDELKKHSKSEDVIKRIGAKRALKILRHDKWHHKVITHTKASHNDSFADRAIYAKVSDLRIAEKILVITQDKKLTNDIRGLNKLESQKGRIINVYLINKNGDLEVNYGEKQIDHKPSRNTVRNKANENPKQKQEQKKTVQEKPKTTDKSPVVLAENALLANINNPNYPVAKKLEDIEKQLGLLKSLKPAERKGLELRLTEEKLLQEKKRLQPPVQEKPKEQKKKEVEKQQPKPYYEFGKTPSQALSKLGKHFGWMFRDSSIPFFKGVHGEYDLTTGDLLLADEKMSSLKTGEKKDLVVQTLVLVFEKKNVDFFVYVKPQTEEEPKQKEEKKQEAPKPKKEKKAEKAPEAAKAKTEKKPKEQKEKKPAKEIKEQAKDAPAAKEKPQPKQTKKKVETKKEAEPKAKKEVKRSAGFEEAVKYDKILNANINNPNYPKENVLKDIEAQVYRVKHLKPGEARELLLGLKALDTKRAEIQNENKQ